MAESDISNEDRRTLGNLAIPRTAAGLAARMASDPDIPARSAEVVNEHLNDLVGRGLVTDLGKGDVADVVKSVKEDKSAINFGRGQITPWKTRAEAGRYDTNGNFYILSVTGLDAIKGGQFADTGEYEGLQEDIDEIDRELGNDEAGEDT